MVGVAPVTVFVRVHKPRKTKTSYRFECSCSAPPSWRNVSITFGFESVGWQIEHEPIWDSLYPMMVLSGSSGPFFYAVKAVRVAFDYPVDRTVVRYYRRQSAHMSLPFIVTSPLTDVRFQGPAQGMHLAMGGGKDSRLLWGMLREIGETPSMNHSILRGASAAADIGGVRMSRGVRGTLMDRIVPGLMLRPSMFYMGHAIGETHHSEPWHDAYDLGGWPAQKAFGRMLASLGAQVNVRTPIAVLPYNLSQKMLVDRYPDLAKHQCSTQAHSISEKNLHISLCKRYHGIRHDSHCSRELFGQLLAKFVTGQQIEPECFGSREWRRVVHHEMRAMIKALLDRGDADVERVSKHIQDRWAARWIDYIHPYMCPDIDGRLLNLMRQHADVVESAPDVTYRVPVGPELPP
jgi:hypothetical protein